MERVAELAAFFKVPAMICLNKYELNPEQAEAIEAYARTKGIKVMGRIPFDTAFTKSMVQGQTVIEYGESEGAKAVKALWRTVEKELLAS